jgi:hypothetical protein
MIRYIIMCNVYRRISTGNIKMHNRHTFGKNNIGYTLLSDVVTSSNIYYKIPA